MSALRLYLAGPEVFLPNGIENAEKQRKLCEKYGFIPMHPMDNNLDLGKLDMEAAMKIYMADIDQLRKSDILVANCNGFRGVCMDDGTAYELGFGNALGKPSYGYIKELTSLVARTVRDYSCHLLEGESLFRDREGYLITDDFGTLINLMMQCGMLHKQGRLIEGDFEACLVALREDLRTGKLTFVSE